MPSGLPAAHHLYHGMLKTFIARHVRWFQIDKQLQKLGDRFDLHIAKKTKVSGFPTVAGLPLVLASVKTFSKPLALRPLTWA